MLLRLLPQPTPSNPSPLTILFTLPLPTHPYVARSLPLPPALLAHKALCLQEDIECSNVLLGEKSSWISGIIDDVTFSLPSASITVNYIDSTFTVLAITPGCIAQLARVVEEVQLSFAVPSQAPASPRSSTSSIASASSASSSMSRTPSAQWTQRRTPSSLLLSLLSPLLSSSATVESTRPTLPTAACSPARAHRRAARSLLVDTYRRHVLPSLKDILPCSFFSWVIASETSQQLVKFNKVQAEVNHIINTCGVSRAELNRSVVTSRPRASSASSTSSMSEDDSDIESVGSPITPSTSIFSTSACPTPSRKLRSPSPQSFMLSIPPAHALPAQHRSAYASLLARLTVIASRINQVKKLGARYEREEGKRRWLEGLERGRLADRAIRRAFSDGIQPLNARAFVTAEVNRSSRLRHSWTAEDQARSELAAAEMLSSHPAMMDVSSDEEVDEGDVFATDSEEESPVTPARSGRSLERPVITIDISPIEIAEDYGSGLKIRRPILERQMADSLVLAPVGVEATPGLVATMSEDDWETETDITTPTLLTPPSIARTWTVSVVPTQQKKVMVQPVDVDSIEDDEQTYLSQCGIYA